MSIAIPSEIFSQFHSGWKIVFSCGTEEPGFHRVYIENPSKGMALNFLIKPENERKLLDSLRKSYRDEEESGLSATS